MFDIKEYYNNYKSIDLDHEIVNINDDINDDIENLLSSRFDRLYARDRFKYSNYSIDIIHPTLSYNGNKSIMTTADKVRYLLSFYPDKTKFENIDKIVLRPRFIEVNNVELVSLYLREKKIIVMYMIHPHLYQINSQGHRHSDFISLDLDRMLEHKATGPEKNNSESDIFIHPLWYVISNTSYKKDDKIDKFFIKKEMMNNTIYEMLIDASFYYSRHGY